MTNDHTALLHRAHHSFLRKVYIDETTKSTPRMKIPSLRTSYTPPSVAASATAEVAFILDPIATIPINNASDRHANSRGNDEDGDAFMTMIGEEKDDKNGDHNRNTFHQIIKDDNSRNEVPIVNRALDKLGSNSIFQHHSSNRASHMVPFPMDENGSRGMQRRIHSNSRKRKRTTKKDNTSYLH